MKKLLAMLMAAAMLVSFAACGGNKEEETTVAPEATTVENVAGDVENEAEEETAEPETEIVTEVVTNADGETEIVTEVVTKEATTKKGETTKKAEKTTAKKEEAKKTTAKKEEGPKPVSQWSDQEILDFYNKAVVATDKKAPKGQSKMVLGYGGKITADGGLGNVLDIVSPIIDKTLKKNSSETSNIPGYGEIKMSDIKSIKATEKGGKIVVDIVGKEQTDGPVADGADGPVGRVIGTLGNIDGALNELGAEISRGKDTVTLTYTDVTVNATINPDTGIIEGGKWHYLVNILVKDADIKLVVKLGVKNLKAAVDYTVTF
ncbi:MAG: hypothetical protein IJ279_02325 [Clostridia bacterium]|nr:hypothetical protein [Clostridia bacterium]